jgi:hypothetical protein
LRDDKVGLEAHLAGDWGEHFAGMREVALTGERSTFEQNLQEDLGVTEKPTLARYHETNKCSSNSQGAHSGIEWSSRDPGVNDVGSSDGVRREERNSFLWRKPGIGEAGKDSSNAVRWLRDGQIRRRGNGRWAPEHELEAGRSRAVGSADCAGKVDAEVETTD